MHDNTEVPLLVIETAKAGQAILVPNGYEDLRVRFRPVEGCVSGTTQGLLKFANQARFRFFRCELAEDVPGRWREEANLADVLDHESAGPRPPLATGAS